MKLFTSVNVVDHGPWLLSKHKGIIDHHEPPFVLINALVLLQPNSSEFDLKSKGYSKFIPPRDVNFWLSKHIIDTAWYSDHVEKRYPQTAYASSCWSFHWRQVNLPPTCSNMFQLYLPHIEISWTGTPSHQEQHPSWWSMCRSQTRQGSFEGYESPGAEAADATPLLVGKLSHASLILQVVFFGWPERFWASKITIFCLVWIPCRRKVRCIHPL